MSKNSDSQRAYRRRQEKKRKKETEKKKKREKRDKKKFFASVFSKISSFFRLVFSISKKVGKFILSASKKMGGVVLSATKKVVEKVKKRREKKKEKKEGKKEMKENKIEGTSIGFFIWSILFIILFLFLEGLILAYQAIIDLSWEKGIISLIFLLVVYRAFIKRLGSYHQQERAVWEFLGRFWKIKGPGLYWRPPLVTQKTRLPISVWEQAISLEDGEKIQLDFLNGGKATLANPKVWVKVAGNNEKEIRENIARMVYEINDWVRAVRERTQSDLKNLFMGLKVEEVFENPHRNWLEPLEERFGTKTEAEKWGVELTQLTIADFGWDKGTEEQLEKVLRARKEVEIKELEAQAAKFEAEKQSHLSGGLLKRIDETLKPTYPDNTVRARVSQEVFEYLLASSSGQLMKIMTGGGGADINSMIAEATAVIESVKKKTK